MQRFLKTSIIPFALLTLLAGFVLAQPMSSPAQAAPDAGLRPQPPGIPEPPQDVDLVICLDTSGSMSGLIESAKQKLWAVVNELATAKRRPNLRVALYQYGNDGLDSETGWVEQLCGLTTDLDLLYEKLFELRTNGGNEYVSRVTRAALKELDWSSRKGALKIIFVAGNEAATQDPEYPLRDICKQAAGAGVIINTLFCGDESSGRSSGWSDAATWADGRYAAIDHNDGTVVLSTPYDKELIELNDELNKTYVGYGKDRETGRKRQLEQDANAATMNAPARADRAAAKASGLYRNASWDLVDAVAEGKVDLAEVPAEDLPEEMRDMSPQERKAYVDTLARKRKELQKKISEIQEQRTAWQRKEMQKRGLDGEESFDTALRQQIREQAQAAGIQFKEESSN